MNFSGDLAKTLLELAPDATVVVEADGTIVFANARIEQTFGYAAGELTGTNVDVLLPVRLRAAHAKHRTQFNAAPKPHTRRPSPPLADPRRGADKPPVRADGIGSAPEETWYRPPPLRDPP